MSNDVLKTLEVCRKNGIWVSINYFMFPGFTDQQREIEAFSKIIDTYKIDYIQMRNLNIDPEIYIKLLGAEAFSDKPLGILNWMNEIKNKFPKIRFGYFNPPKEDFNKFHKLI